MKEKKTPHWKYLILGSIDIRACLAIVTLLVIILLQLVRFYLNGLFTKTPENYVKQFSATKRALSNQLLNNKLLFTFSLL